MGEVVTDAIGRGVKATGVGQFGHATDEQCRGKADAHRHRQYHIEYHRERKTDNQDGHVAARRAL